MIDNIDLIRTLVRLYHDSIIDLLPDIVHTDRIRLLVSDSDNIRMIAGLSLTAGVTGIARLRSPLFTQKRHCEKICQHLLSGAPLSVHNVCVGYLIHLYRILDIINNVFVAYHIFKASHVAFPL